VQSDIWVSHTDHVEFYVRKFGDEGELWYTVELSGKGDGVKLYINHNQLSELIKTCAAAMMDEEVVASAPTIEVCTVTDHESQFDARLGSGVPMSTWTCPACDRRLCDLIEYARRDQLIDIKYGPEPPTEAKAAPESSMPAPW